MVSVWTWVLVGIVVYTIAAMALRAQGRLPDSVKVSGPIVTIHTQRGRILLDRLAERERFWRAWGNLGVGITFVVMALSGLVVVFAVLATLNQPESAAIENPQNVLVIPGVNEFLPLNAAVEIIFGLLVGLVVHEGGHGLLCRVEDIDIESMGVAMFAFIPVGAFVEPDAEDQEAADRGAQVRMFAAGITNNFAITIIAMVVLIGPVLGSIGVVPGAPVGDTFPGSGADDAGIEHGDVITAINGTTVDNASHLDDVVAGVEGDRLAVSFEGRESVTVDRRLLVIGIVEGVGDDIRGQDPLTQVEAVNGTPVGSERGFRTAVGESHVATLQTTRGNTTIPVGAFVNRALSGEALADAGGPTDGTPIIVTAIDGERIHDRAALSTALDDYAAGDEATVTAYVDGDREEFAVEMGDGELTLGVSLQDGYSGILLDDFGVDAYPAGEFLSILDGSAIPGGSSLPTGILIYTLQLLVLPFMALMDPSFNYSFAGFTPDVTTFFVVDGPLAFMGGGLFLVANLLFWTGWINFNLALFNCIPAFPLDGGHIFRVGTESVVSRLPIEGGRRLVTLITVGVTVTMLAALAILVFGPLWL